MADQIVTIPVQDLEADGASTIGKVVNFYDTYANALAHAATGLATVKDVNRLTGAVGAAISQTAKTAGPTVDNNGLVVVALDDNGGAGQEYFWISEGGRQSGPRRIVVQP